MRHWKTKINAYERLMRLDKPVGILLLLWPTLWALLIAMGQDFDWKITLIFVMGTVLMRSAGCVMNDIADRKFDGLVERTKNRPLATNEVSVKEAYLLALSLCLVAFCFVSFLNIQTILLSIVALFFAATYPYTKRFLAIPQAYLGIAFGMGIPMAFMAIAQKIPPLAWVLMLANVAWAIAYDTQYAMVDKGDDLKIGIRSSAIFFGRFELAAIMVCYAMLLVCFIYLGNRLSYGSGYFVGLALALVLIIRQFFLTKKRTKTDSFNAFMQNNWLGLVFLFSIASQYYG